MIILSSMFSEAQFSSFFCSSIETYNCFLAQKCMPQYSYWQCSIKIKLRQAQKDRETCNLIYTYQNEIQVHAHLQFRVIALLSNSFYTRC